MNGLRQEITRWLDHGETPSPERVEELHLACPCFLLPAALLLRNKAEELDDSTRAALTRRLAVAAPDIEEMSLATDADLSSEFCGFYPEEQKATPSTDAAIDRFISAYGSENPEEEALLTRLIFNPTPDYAQILAREEEDSVPDGNEAPDGSQDQLINSFIIKSKAAGGQFPSAAAPAASAEQPAPVSAVGKPAAADDSLLSESLAHIYIRRGNYAKAYEIISHLNLNFPEKSIYFADQLRFLRKLMLLEGSIRE